MRKGEIKSFPRGPQKADAKVLTIGGTAWLMRKSKKRQEQRSRERAYSHELVGQFIDFGVYPE